MTVLARGATGEEVETAVESERGRGRERWNHVGQGRPERETR